MVLSSVFVIVTLFGATSAAAKENHGGKQSSPPVLLAPDEAPPEKVEIKDERMRREFAWLMAAGVAGGALTGLMISGSVVWPATIIAALLGVYLPAPLNIIAVVLTLTPLLAPPVLGTIAPSLFFDDTTALQVIGGPVGAMSGALIGAIGAGLPTFLLFGAPILFGPNPLGGSASLALFVGAGIPAVVAGGLAGLAGLTLGGAGANYLGWALSAPAGLE